MPDTSNVSDHESVLPDWVSLFLDNPGMTIGSLLAAVIIFFYIRGKVEDRIFISATPKLEISAQEDFVITKIRDYKNTVVTDQLQLSLRGPLAKLERIKQNEQFRIEKTIPLPEGWDPGEPIPVEITEKDLKMQSGNLPLGIHMEQSSITLYVTAEKFVEEERPIFFDELEKNIDRFVKGQPASDYRVSELASKIQSVTVSGPKSSVEKTRIRPAEPIDVVGKSSSITRLVQLRSSASSDHVSISPESVRITARITSKMTKRTIEVPYQISMWEELFKVIQKRGWNISKEKLKLTLRLPRTIQKEELNEDTILPVVILKKEDLNILTKPAQSFSMDKVRVLFSDDLQNRDMIEVIDIDTGEFYFESRE